jgi:predicted DNA-binding transcriptional regulator YafY
MSRANRLLKLIEILRSNRYPIAGEKLAHQLNVSLRTLYRDIKTLQHQGANIEGEAGLGYILRPGFLLPPLMFSMDEIEAIVLGMRWVSKRGDQKLSDSAKSALYKIATVIPSTLKEELEVSSLLVGPSSTKGISLVDVSLIREAIRQRIKIKIDYLDLREEHSKRLLWPFAIGYFDNAQVLVAWCELRQAFRHFRLDRIQHLHVTETKYPKTRQTLLKEWRQINNISPQ